MGRRHVGAMSAVLALVACSAPSPKAAEPAVAPTGAAPVGTVSAVGSRPEGIVYDPRTGLLAVAVRAPDRLVVLDGSGIVQRTVDLPGHARHLQLGELPGQVLVPAEDADTMLRVDVVTGRSEPVPVGDHPHDAAATSDGFEVVGDEFAGSVSVLRDGRVVRTVRGFEQPGGVIALGDRAVVVDVKADTVTPIDPVTGRTSTSVPAGRGPTHAVALSGQRFAVADTRGEAVLVYAMDPLRRVGRLAVTGSPYGLGYDATRRTLWVTLTGRNEALALDVSGDTPREVARYRTVEQPNTLAVVPADGSIWVTGTRRGELQHIEP